MATLSFEQVYALARNAGFGPDQAVIMTALTVPESGRSTTAHAQDSDDNSYGLWQINMLGAMGPNRRRSLGLRSNDDLLDPFTNARAAKAIFDSQGFGAWGAYNTGKYQPYLDEARAARARVEGPRGNYAAVLASIPGTGKNPIQKGVDAVKGAAGDAASAFTEPFAQAYESARQGVASFATKAGFVVLGLTLVSLGAYRMVQPTIRRMQDRGAELAGAAAKGAAL